MRMRAKATEPLMVPAVETMAISLAVSIHLEKSLKE